MIFVAGTLMGDGVKRCLAVPTHYTPRTQPRNLQVMEYERHGKLMPPKAAVRGVLSTA